MSFFEHCCKILFQRKNIRVYSFSVYVAFPPLLTALYIIKDVVKTFYFTCAMVNGHSQIIRGRSRAGMFKSYIKYRCCILYRTLLLTNETTTFKCWLQLLFANCKFETNKWYFHRYVDCFIYSSREQYHFIFPRQEELNRFRFSFFMLAGLLLPYCARLHGSSACTKN